MKNLLLILTSLYLVLFTQAQDIAPGSEHISESTLLWKIEGPDIQTSYVYGTIHLIPKEDFFITQATQKAIEVSDQIILELDYDDPSFQKDVALAMTFQNGESLKDYCTQEEYRKLKNAVKHAGPIVRAMMSRFKPIMLMGLIMDESITGEDPVSYELYLVDQAQQSGKQILGLEDAYLQTAVFDAIPYDEQIDMIIEAYIDSIDITRRQMDSIYDYYIDQNIQSLYDVSIGGELFDELIPKLFDDRNLDWSQQVGTLCRDRSCFIAVGAGHLAGRRGFLQLLRDQGYSVTPIH